MARSPTQFVPYYLNGLVPLSYQVRSPKLTVGVSHSSLHTNRYRVIGTVPLSYQLPDDQNLQVRSSKLTVGMSHSSLHTNRYRVVPPDAPRALHGHDSQEPERQRLPRRGLARAARRLAAGVLAKVPAPCIMLYGIRGCGICL